MHRTIIGHIHVAIRAHCQLLTLLGIAIDIDDELITRAQHVVLRRSDVHHRLKGQRFVVEDITAKDFFAFLFLLLFEIKRVWTLVHRHVIAIQPAVWTIHHHLLLAHLLSLVVDLPERSVVLTHTIGRFANGFVGRLTHACLLQLTGVLLTHLLDLLQRSTLLKQLLGNIGLGLTQFLLLHDILQYLRFSHALLSKRCQ